MKLIKQLLWLTGVFVLFFSCKKEKSVERALGAGTPTGWEFKDSTKVFKGRMDTAYLQSVGSISSIILEGTSLDGTSDFYLEIFGINVAPGTYKNPNVQFAYVTNGTVLYESVPANTDKFTVTITSLDANGISGTFSGEVEDVLGKTKIITGGTFTSKFSNTSTPPPTTTTGLLTLWAKKACAGTATLTVKLQNQTGTITTFHTTGPNCGATGTASFTLPAGNYTWKAFCGTTDSVSGTVSVVAGQCLTREVIFPAVSLPAAQFTLASSGANCSNTKVNGTYVVGTPLSATNSVEVEVNVTIVGSYNIITALKNGISFEGTGVFTTTGLQKITLTGKGNPTTAGANSISISAGTSNCAFNVAVTAAPPGGGGTTASNSWSFNDGSLTYSGKFVMKGSFSASPVGSGKILELYGTTGADTLFGLRMHFQGNNVTKPIPGTYITDPSAFSQNLNDFEMSKLTAGTLTGIYRSYSNTGAGSNVIMSLVITSYDDATKTVQGTFSGKAYNKNGVSVDITNGKFSSEVDL